MFANRISVIVVVSVVVTAGLFEAVVTQGAPWRTVRSRAGDTTILQILLDSPANAELALQRSGQIGAAAGPPEQLIGMITHTHALPNGSVIFYDGNFREVRWFDSSLKLVRIVAKEGQGPGEIPPSPRPTSPSPRVIIEDKTIWKIGVGSQGRIVALYSNRGRGAFVYDSIGVFRSGFVFPRDVAADFDQTAVVDDVILVRGQLLSGAESCTGPIGEPLCRPMAVRMNLSGTRSDTLLAPDLPWNAPMKFTSSRLGDVTRKLFVRVPFAVYPIIYLSDLGYWISASPDKYEITLHRPAGGAVRVTSNSPAIPVQPGERQAAFSQWSPRFAANQPASNVSINDIPQVKPRIRTITTDSDGRIWVQLHSEARRSVYQPPPPSPGLRGGAPPPAPAPVEQWTESYVYDIFSAAGEYLGRLRPPAGVGFTASSGKYLWSREADSLDVQRLVRYTITPRSPQSPAAQYWLRGR